MAKRTFEDARREFEFVRDELEAAQRAYEDINQNNSQGLIDCTRKITDLNLRLGELRKEKRTLLRESEHEL